MAYKGLKTVPDGGTNKQSHTTYGVITGGTTTTGTVQNVTNGDSGTVLTSQGASLLPSWVLLPTIWENLAGIVTGKQ